MRFARFAFTAIVCAAGLAAVRLAGQSDAVQPARPLAPAYSWRGISLDVARRYFPPAAIRRAIDLAAHYRLNVVHLHLTDNEAWRLPSARYPLLPSARHYTLAQLRDLVAYARGRGIALVPEIDLPAHTAAAIRAYPSLSCGAADTLCPRGALTFARAIVGEANAIFPGPYVHTGGDEVDGWTARQRRDFERGIDATLRRAQRTMVVWDDESDAAPADAIVEVWHLGDAATRATRLGHRVVMAPDGPLYFDAVQGDSSQEPAGSPYMSTLEEVYAYTPPAGAFGVEGVVWSERITDDSRLWYMLLPREIALSAVAVNGRRKLSWPAFRERVLPREFAWLQRNGYPFRMPNTNIAVDGAFVTYRGVPGNTDAAVAYTPQRRVRIRLRTLVPHARIQYRLSGGARWLRYAGTFAVDASRGTIVRAQTVSPDGRSSAITALTVRQAADPAGSRSFDAIVSP